MRFEAEAGWQRSLFTDGRQKVIRRSEETKMLPAAANFIHRYSTPLAHQVLNSGFSRIFWKSSIIRSGLKWILMVIYRHGTNGTYLQRLSTGLHHLNPHCFHYFQVWPPVTSKQPLKQVVNHPDSQESRNYTDSQENRREVENR